MGIVLGAWLHGDWEHLLSNTMAFLMLGIGVFVLYPSLAEKVVWINFFLTGSGVWLFARPAYHIGASGWVYSLASFLFFSGVFRRDRRSLLISSIMVLLYAGIIETIFPSQKTVLEHISWESHLIGVLVGAFMAFSFRNEIPDKEALLDIEESTLSSYTQQGKEGLMWLENEKIRYVYKEKNSQK